MSLEQIVRPFASSNVLLTKKIAKNTKTDPSQALLSWGSAGSTPQAEQIPNTQWAIAFKYCDDQYDETQRTTKQVRVENPDDPTQYVIVERPTSISFAKKKPEYRLNSVTFTSNSRTAWVSNISDNSGQLNDVTDNGCDQKYNLDKDQ